jgi:hypothetical protein
MRTIRFTANYCVLLFHLELDAYYGRVHPFFFNKVGYILDTLAYEEPYIYIIVLVLHTRSRFILSGFELR